MEAVGHGGRLRDWRQHLARGRLVRRLPEQEGWGGVDEEERGAELFYRIEGSLCCGAFNFDGVNMTMR